MRMPASEKDLEKLRNTTRLGNFLIREIAEASASSAKSMYASSTTSTPATVAANLSMAQRESRVPDGEFGLQTKVNAAFAPARDSGKEKSAVYSTVKCSPYWISTSVSYSV